MIEIPFFIISSHQKNYDQLIIHQGPSSFNYV